MLDIKKQMEVERVARWLMALILLTAGTSKLFSKGGFNLPMIYISRSFPLSKLS